MPRIAVPPRSVLHGSGRSEGLCTAGRTAAFHGRRGRRKVREPALLPRALPTGKAIAAAAAGLPAWRGAAGTVRVSQQPCVRHLLGRCGRADQVRAAPPRSRAEASRTCCSPVCACACSVPRPRSAAHAAPTIYCSPPALPRLSPSLFAVSPFVRGGSAEAVEVFAVRGDTDTAIVRLYRCDLCRAIRDKL